MDNVLALNPRVLINGRISLRPSARFFTLFCLILASFLLIFYVFQINKLVKESYLVQDYQQRGKKIAQENEALETSLAQTGTLKTIDGLVKGMNFEEISHVYYVQTSGSQVVKR